MAKVEKNGAPMNQLLPGSDGIQKGGEGRHKFFLLKIPKGNMKAGRF
jgi:hypothetical protein